MTEHYNCEVAAHYSAYRPPLHRLILGKVLPEDATFSEGLDVGCGTGYSAIALAERCRHVTGIEPSEAMLKQTKRHDKITYLKGSGQEMPLKDRSVDVVTFAGSLYYSKSELLIEELLRVCKPTALIIAYDFEILINEALQKFGVCAEGAVSSYDHSSNLKDRSEFEPLTFRSEEISLEVSAAEFAHILLSDSNRYEAFVSRFGPAPFEAILCELTRSHARHSLAARIYFSKYRIAQ